MAGAKITIQNAKRIQNLFRSLPDAMKGVANDLIVREFEVAVKEAKSIANTAKYTGELSDGIRLELVEGKYQYKSTAKHAAFAEFGTRGSYRPVSGFERWAMQYKGIRINQSGTAWERIKAWAEYRGIEEKFHSAIYRKIVLQKGKDGGMKAIPHPNHGGYFLPPYIRAKGRIVRKLKQLLAQANKKTRK